MITLKDFMETVDYRITEGSKYGWNCFGANAYCLDSWSGYDDSDHEYSISVIFDTATQDVYQFDAHDYVRQRSYRWLHPDYVNAHRDEACERNVDASEAWDEVKFVDLETREDMLEKARAIVAGRNYDTRVSIPVDIPDHVLFTLMKSAHERDITLNQLFEEIITDAIHCARQTAPWDDDEFDSAPTLRKPD